MNVEINERANTKKNHSLSLEENCRKNLLNIESVVIGNVIPNNNILHVLQNSITEMS